MAIFKGKNTEHKTAITPKDNQFELIATKLVPASQHLIQYIDSPNRLPDNWDFCNSFSEFKDLEKNEKGILCYRVKLYKWKDNTYHVIISLNVNNSMRMIFTDRDKALKCFDAIQPYTQKKTLRARGFFTW